MGRVIVAPTPMRSKYSIGAVNYVTPISCSATRVAYERDAPFLGLHPQTIDRDVGT